MTSPDSKLNRLADSLAKVDRELKDLEKQREDLRKELFGYATRAAQDQYLIRRTLTIPRVFFDRTKMTFEQFVESRYPTWALVDHTKDGSNFVLLIEENPEFKSWSHTSTSRFVVGRQIAQSPPMIDTDTLKMERPDLFEQIMKPVIVYELEEDALVRAVAENPELVEVMQRHYSYPRKPSKKLAPIRLATGEIE